MTTAVPSAPSGAIPSRPQSGTVPPSSRAALDAALDTLAARRAAWATLPVLDRIALLRKLRESFAEVAEEWTHAAMRAEGLSPRDRRSGEEWIVGPYFVLRNLRLLQTALRNISVTGRPRIPGPVRRLPNGQVAARVVPYDSWDVILYRGVMAEVWMEPEVTPEGLPETQAVAYRDPDPRGAVALVLSAGNVSSIGPMDALHELFVDNQVVVFKVHEVNDYLGPLLERGFRPLIEAGFLRVVYGGPEEGAYLCEHPAVDAIHITGSDKTYEAIVFGPGEEGARRKRENRPRLAKPVSAELGNVSPVVVVPGRWSREEIAYHAENIATMLVNNAGFNCNAVRALVTWQGWDQRDELLAALREVLRRVPPRHAWYPGAGERYRAFVEAHPEAERYGGAAGDQLPWTLIPGVPPGDDSLCFTTESFCSVFCETPLAAASAAEYLRQAVAFCNDRLWGSLNVTLLVHPRAQQDAELAPTIERAVADLRYGTVAVNHWAAIGYGLVVTPWGAYPGNTPQEIGSGTGFVHNTLMFSRVQKTVVLAPFTAWPKPPWFITHQQAYELGRKLTAFEAGPAPWKLPGILRLALQG
ncbi:MAG TPA: aldehyde dehydrogenase family protein [Thermoanaerobaculia bacterium]|nr:aldehyde dehydrogenase family protein [Thermoanaerobaculia bacterium]